MDKLVVFNNADLSRLINIRPFESKFGEYINILPPFCNIYEELQTLDVEFVLLGLPEDVGIFANLGNGGASSAWEYTLKNLLNIQKNEFTNPEKLLILGYLDFQNEIDKIKSLDRSIDKELAKSRKIVAKIDKYVTHLIYSIVKAGKKPIIIGGGHNNAYGNIKGSALALGKSINVVNLDAHTNLRHLEGRHSGNGFTYAFAEGFLKHYFIFGLHENYTSNTILKTIKKLKNVNFCTYEDIEIKEKTSFKTELQNALSIIDYKPFGIEIDCDAIENINSSEMSPSGFSVKKARRFVHFFANHNNAHYIHICNAIANENNASQIGKLISYLVTDFIKANSK